MDQEQEMEEEERIRMPNTTPGSRNFSLVAEDQFSQASRPTGC